MVGFTQLSMWSLVLVMMVSGILTVYGGKEDEYREVGKDLHNQYRAQHNVLPLKLNETLNQAAQSFAEHLIKTGQFRNKVEPGILKNLYSFKGDPTEPPIDEVEAVKLAVAKWYGSIKQYNWGRPDYTAFSAIVWKSTTDVGIGLANKGSRTIVVAAYSPPGNIVGEGGIYFKENVNRPA